MDESTVDFIVRSAVTGLIGFGSGGGLIAWVNAHRSRRAEVSGNERIAERDRVADLEHAYARELARAEKAEAQCRAANRRANVWEDYAGRLRKHIHDGAPPPPEDWPDLT